MTYEEFVAFLDNNVAYEAIYEDLEERKILIVSVLCAYFMVLQAIKDEREACAKMCDEWPHGRDDVCLIADAIRARSET